MHDIIKIAYVLRYGFKIYIYSVQLQRVSGIHGLRGSSGSRGIGSPPCVSNSLGILGPLGVHGVLGMDGPFAIDERLGFDGVRLYGPSIGFRTTTTLTWRGMTLLTPRSSGQQLEIKTVSAICIVQSSRVTEDPGFSLIRRYRFRTSSMATD